MHSPFNKRPNLDVDTTRDSYNTAFQSPCLTPKSPNKTNFLRKAQEISLDPQAAYTISFNNGATEHGIDTGKTFEEAKLKIVFLTCELEKVHAYNYSLVQENEVLRTHTNKSLREKDLETKMSIVLAENTKLRGSTDEIYELYREQKKILESREHENLEEWKKKYSLLEVQANEEINRMNGELTKMKNEARFQKEVEKKAALLAVQNERLRVEVETLKSRLARMGELEGKFKEYTVKTQTLLEANDNLNGMLQDKIEEIEELKHEAETKKVHKLTNAERNLTSLLQDKINEIGQLRDKLAEKEEKEEREKRSRSPIGRRGEEETKKMVRFAQRREEDDDMNGELRRKLEKLTEENQRLNGQLRLLMGSSEYLKLNEEHIRNWLNACPYNKKL